MKKEWMKIVVAILMLFGIAIPLSLHREKKMKQEVEKDNDKKFITFNMEDLDRIQIVNADGTVELQKRKKDASGQFQDEFEVRNFEFIVKPEWVVVQPYHALADSMLVNSFMDQVKGIEYQKIIQENQDRKTDYNLAKPQLTVRFFDVGQNESKLTLNMGSENPTGTGFYFISSNKPGIYLGERLLQPYVDQKPYQWRERRVVEFPNLNDLIKIEIKHFDKNRQSFVLSKNDGNWKFFGSDHLVDPDQNAVTDFAGHISGMRAIRSHDDRSVLSKSKKLCIIDLYLKDRNEPVEFTVLDGGNNPSIYYLERKDINEIFSVADDPKLILSYQDMVDKNLLTKSFADMVSINVSAEGKNLEIVKEDDFWKIKKPYQDEASSKRLDSFFQLIKEIKPRSYLPKKNLSNENRKLHVDYMFTDKTKGSIDFYQEGKFFFASAVDQDKRKILSIDQISSELFEHFSHFRNDDVLSIPDDHLKYLTFSRDGIKVELEQDMKLYRFFVKSLENVPPSLGLKWKEKTLPEQLYKTVSEMYLRDFLENSNPNEKFETAELKITDDQNREYHWKFGKKQGEMIRVYSPERKIIGLIPWIKYNELSQYLDEPKKTNK